MVSNCLLIIRVTIGSASLKKPPASVSIAMLILVPPLTRSKLNPPLRGKGPDVALKLYLEFGGKLLYDYHASRVLPGYDPNIKMRLLQELKAKADILLCIYAGDIERKKMRADFGITYDSDALKLIDDLRGWGINVLGVVITRFENQPSAEQFKNKLERRKIRVYTH